MRFSAGSGGSPRAEALASAKARLDRLDLYPCPVRIDRVRVVVSAGLFRLPLLRRFDGYAMWGLILLRRPPREHDDLLTHELCHVWQMQHHPVRMPLSFLLHGYEGNPYELQARAAAHDTRDSQAQPDALRRPTGGS